MRIITYILIAAFLLCSCKTKEKVTEHMSEVAHSTAENTKVSAATTDNQIQSIANALEITTEEQDSFVSKTHERIVLDSDGNVLSHEVEHTEEQYSTNGKKNVSRKQQEESQQNIIKKEQTKESSDSTYDDDLQSETKTVKKSWQWVWYVGFLVIIFLGGFIISLIVKR